MQKVTSFLCGSIEVSVYRDSETDPESYSVEYLVNGEQTPLSAVPSELLPSLMLLTEKAWGWIQNKLTSPIHFEAREGMGKLDNERAFECIEERQALIIPEDCGKSARKWWDAFLRENSERPLLALRLTEEIISRDSDIQEFFLAYVYSNTDNIQANLHFLDFRRIIQSLKKGVKKSDIQIKHRSSSIDKSSKDWAPEFADGEIVPANPELRSWIRYGTSSEEAKRWWHLIELREQDAPEDLAKLSLFARSKSIFLDDLFLYSAMADTDDISALTKYIEYQLLLEPTKSAKDLITNQQVAARKEFCVEATRSLKDRANRYLLGQLEEVPTELASGLLSADYNGSELMSCRTCQKLSSSHFDSCVHCENPASIHDQLLLEEIKIWSEALTCFKGWPTRALMRAIVRELGEEIRQIIRSGHILNLPEAATKLSKGLMYLTHEKEICYALALELPHLSEIDTKQAAALYLTLDAVREKWPNIITKGLGFKLPDQAMAA